LGGEARGDHAVKPPVLRHGSGAGPRVPRPTPEDLSDPAWHFKPRERGESYRWFHWMCRNLFLFANRRLRERSEAAAKAFDQAHIAALASRHAYVAADWSNFERQIERHDRAMLAMRIAHMAPYALKGKASVDGAPKGNEARRDRALQKAHRSTARARAREMWSENPALTLAAIAEKLADLGYASDTIARWVRDLSPTPLRRGRPIRKTGSTP
jgi:hypothetical protein